MLSLYPEIEPFSSYYLSSNCTGKKLATEHQIYVEQCGNPSGIPVVFLHGGPGSGCRPSHRCFFDPKRYHIILFDQRGCGRSRPLGTLVNNTTDDLIQDMEHIRQHIGIKNWLVFGGSWGSTLGLYYASHYAEHVSGLILRGLFLGRQQDIDWVYTNNGAAKIFPEAWHNLIKDLPCSQQAKPLTIIYQQLVGDDIQLSNAMFDKLQRWESSLVYWQKSLSFEEKTDKQAIKFEEKSAPIIQLYYSLNQCFIADSPLLEIIENIRHIPTKIIHGRQDMVCPVEQAWQLKQHWPEADLSIIDMAGHVASEAKLINALLEATNDFATLNTE